MLRQAGTALLLRRATSQVQQQLPSLQQAAASLQHPQHHPQQQRRFAADAGDGSGPMIIPARQQQQQQQPAVPQRVKEVALVLPETNRGPWERAVDKASGGTYWWNASTDVTTPVGAPKPDAWLSVVDEAGQSYFWNKQSNETTAVGEALPGPEGRIMAAAAGAGAGQQQPRQSVMGVLGNSLAMGFGVGLVFALIRVVF